MQNYEVKTPVRGLPRVDGLKKPVDIGEVVALPFTRALELLGFGAIEETRAEVTCALHWDDETGLLSAPIAVVAVTDRYALMSAIEELGGIVFFVGEGLPDDAEEVLTDFSNDQLLAELATRIGGNRLTTEALLDCMGITLPTAEAASEAPADDVSDKALASAAEAADSSSSAVEPDSEITAKPSRKKSAQ